MRSKRALGDFLVAYLRHRGVTHLFGIPGDLVLRLFTRLTARRALRVVTFSHEPAVGFAADGYARATGRLAVACVTYGAGGHNMVNAVAGSFAEHVPVLVLSGGPGDGERKLGTLIHHQAKAVDSQLRIYREVTCMARLVRDPRTAAQEIDEVVREIWREQRPGYVEIHRDMVDAQIEVPPGVLDDPPSPGYARSDPGRLREAVAETVARIASARRPIVFAGIETFRFRVQREVLELCERLGAPVLTSMLAKGAVPIDHPLYMGVFTGAASPKAMRARVEAADLVLDLGTMLTDVDLGSHSPIERRDRTVWAVDGRVDVGFHSFRDVELRDFVRGLLGAELRHHRETVRSYDNLPAAPAWLAARRGVRVSRAAAERSAAAPIRVADLLHAVNDFLQRRRGWVVVAESGDMLFAGLDVRVGGSASYFAQGYYASMGYGVPGAMGIQIGTGKRPLVLSGDGAFQMTGPEIAQAVRNGTNPVVVVLNNRGWGIFRPVVERRELLQIPDWPYAELARLWGGNGFRVRTGPEFRDALEAAAADDRFAVLEVLVDEDDRSPLGEKYIKISARKR